MVMSKIVLVKKKRPAVAKPLGAVRQIAAGEFKARCLRLMDEIKETGKPLIVTKRGVPMVRLVPIAGPDARPKSIIGRLEGIMRIVGDPDDLIKPIFPLEDYDMLK
jgi:prevent-host-death family protein